MYNLFKYINEEDFEFRRMSEVWPGSSQIAFNIEDAFKVLDILRAEDIVLFGVELISEENNILDHAFNIWGFKCYPTDWWYDVRSKDTPKVGCFKKLYAKAKKVILKLIYALFGAEYPAAKRCADAPAKVDDKRSKFANEIKYLDDSYAKAKKAILQFIKSSKKYENKCYIVFSVGEKLSWLTTPLGPYYPI